MLTQPGHLDHPLPAEPILRHLHRAGGPFAALSAAGYHEGTRERERLGKAVERAIRRGHVSVVVADEICCRVLGVHPVHVYGDAWWDGLLDPAGPGSSAARWLENAS